MTISETPGEQEIIVQEINQPAPTSNKKWATSVISWLENLIFNSITKPIQIPYEQIEYFISIQECSTSRGLYI